MLPTSWNFYASDIGHNLYIEITNNNFTDKGICYHLRGVVYSHVKDSETICEIMEDYEEYNFNTLDNLTYLLAQAQFMIDHIVDKFDIKFVYGEEAWLERLKPSLTTITDYWNRYVTNTIGKCSTAALPINKYQMIQQWISAWKVSDNPHKNEFIKFGKNKLFS